MTLLQEIKDASVEARKSRDGSASLLITLYSESAMVGKNKGNRESTDQEVISVCKKFKAGLLEVKSINETRGNFTGVELADFELSIVEKYLPKMMEEDELREMIRIQIAEDQLTSMKDLGKVMTFLKYNFEGLYDGATATKIAKEYLS